MFACFKVKIQPSTDCGKKLIKPVSLSDDELARRLQAEEDALANLPSLFYCDLCLETKNGKDGIKLHCNHVVCEACLKIYAKMAIENTELISCPKCREPLSNGEIKVLLGMEMAEKYIAIEVIKLRQDTSLFNCPTPDCPNSVYREENVDRFDCVMCNKSYCLPCKSEYHEGLTCKQNTQQIAVNCRRSSLTENKVTNEESLEELLKEGKLKQCHCGNYIEKNGGCWYIKCPMCHLGFCWKCNKILGNGTPNCAHTRGHGANPYQWNIEENSKLERRQNFIRQGKVQRGCNIM
eukprot:TRINITY_DN1292_c0_g2_i1.p1 TRINITY_DN1292_c0_g2~~TRINITY_DN1292_c0_g2_i1.p1  ORF type:complete len:293 (-),score=18.21 TRINITY_DN1292_c0_g2_i1:70-948(-)